MVNDNATLIMMTNYWPDPWCRSTFDVKCYSAAHWSNHSRLGDTTVSTANDENLSSFGEEVGSLATRECWRDYA